MIELWIGLAVILLFSSAFLLLATSENTGSIQVTDTCISNNLEEISYPRYINCYSFNGLYPNGSYYDTINDWVVSYSNFIPSVEDVCSIAGSADDINNCISKIGQEQCAVAIDNNKLLYVVSLGRFSCFSPLPQPS